MTYGVLLERENSVARITLDRPEVGNAIDLPMARALLEAAIVCDEDEAIRCVVLSGRGRMFCVGGDIGAFASAGDGLPALLKELLTYLNGAIIRLVRMDKPLLCAINGPAAGAGIGLALIGDIVLAAPQAHFTLAYTAIGMSPDAATTWLLPRLVGLRKAQELMLRNSRVGAGEAAAAGLITRVATDGALATEISAVAAELAGGARSAIAATRRLLLETFSTTIETQLEAEARGIATQARSAEGQEGVSAFVAKRPPKFL